MKFRTIAAVAVAAAMGMAGPATAANWSWTGTLADWAAAAGGTGVIVDGDGDAAFRLYPSTDLPDGVGGYIELSEIEVGGKDYYDVGVSWDRATGFPNGYGGGHQLVFTLEIVGATPERITGAALDSVITGSGTVAAARLYDLPASVVFGTLTSTDGARDPATGYWTFGGRSIVGVQEYFVRSDTGVYQDAHISFVSSVPEPAGLALLGLAAVALGVARRRKR